jgi:hypothetical protein
MASGTANKRGNDPNQKHNCSHPKRKEKQFEEQELDHAQGNDESNQKKQCPKQNLHF